MHVNNTISSATTAYSTINLSTDSNKINFYNGPMDGFSNDSVSLCTSGKPDNLSRGLSGMGQAVYLRGNNKKNGDRWMWAMHWFSHYLSIH